jgi:hypothetical protein
MKARPLQPFIENPAQLVLAAIKMIAAGNVEQQPIGRIDRDHRREAVAIFGNAFEKIGIGERIHLLDAQIGNARPRIGQRKAWCKTEPACLRTHRRKPHSALYLLDQDKRRLIGFVMRSLTAIGRKEGQPESEIPLPCPWSLA